MSSRLIVLRKELSMKIGMSLPQSLLDPDIILDWVRRVDQGPFSTLSVLDRVVYSNPAPLLTLTMAAAVSRRVRLMTEVLVSPLRNATLLAKEVATLDAFSRGRVTLGLGVGIRDDDFLATGATTYHTRGKYIEEQIEEMRRVWSGKPLGEHIGPVGPTPVQKSGPELILGGVVPIALQRAARLADGVVTALNDPGQIDKSFRLVEQTWKEVGRPGKPRLLAQIDIGLETAHDDRAIDTLMAYYKAMPPYDTYKASALIRTDQQLRDILKAVEQLGADEVSLFTWSDDIDQIERIATLIH